MGQIELSATPGRSGPGSNGNKEELPHSLKPQHHCNLTIRLFSVMSRTFTREALPLCRDADLMVESAGCEELVTQCEVHDTLKQGGLNKSSGLDDLTYEVYLRMSHMFVPILMDMFNHRFAQ